MSQNKEITFWAQAGWDHQTYKEVVDTGIPLGKWEKMTEDEREDACDEIAKEEFNNIMGYGWYE